MSSYKYFPSTHDGPIKTLLLDANVTGHLDSIAQRGPGLVDPVVRRRMADLVDRLDKNVVVMPGLGAGESVMRRKGMKEFANYSRRSVNAFAMLADDSKKIRAWLNGDTTGPHCDAESERRGARFAKDFEIMRENMVVPSYAMVLKSYELYLRGGSPEPSFRELAAFAEELYGRGSREVMLGALLLAGNARGREMALNIMKLRQSKEAVATLDALWNTSFDLTYSRVAVMPSLPGFAGAFELPCVLVTDDKALGRFLDIIRPSGAVALSRGGGATADFADLRGLLQEGAYEMVGEVIDRGNRRMYRDETNLGLMTKIRRFKAQKYAQHLEGWFVGRG